MIQYYYYRTFIVINFFIVPQDRHKLVRILEQVLQRYSADLNDFLEGDTLKAVANTLYQEEIITRQLRNSPVYNDIELQFIKKVKFLKEMREVESCCGTFISALKSQGGPLINLADDMASKWRSDIMNDLQIDLTWEVLY